MESCPYEMQYHYHLQGYIYNLLKGSKYDYVHDKEGYKFFCFSNIFPANALMKDDLRTLIISSPDSVFIAYLQGILRKEWNKYVKIGNMKFSIDSLDKLDIRLPDNSPFTLITGTPIVIRIPREKYKAYGAEPKGSYSYVYWRSEHPIDLFVSQVESNLMKKYAEYKEVSNGRSSIEDTKCTEDSAPSLSFFQKFKFKKQISTRVFMKGFEQVVIGTIWEFMFEGRQNRDLVHFAVDAGMGERNSLGFGFMNLVPNK